MDVLILLCRYWHLDYTVSSEHHNEHKKYLKNHLN